MTVSDNKGGIFNNLPFYFLLLITIFYKYKSKITHNKKFLKKKMIYDMTNNTWKEICIREKFQIINGTILVLSAIILYFLAFLLTLSIGFDIISAGATLLATGLAFFGISTFVKNQMVHFETSINEKLKKLENDGKFERENTHNISSDDSSFDDKHLS